LVTAPRRGNQQEQRFMNLLSSLDDLFQDLDAIGLSALEEHGFKAADLDDTLEELRADGHYVDLSQWQHAHRHANGILVFKRPTTGEIVLVCFDRDGKADALAFSPELVKH
jgi:hypothetical protein